MPPGVSPQPTRPLDRTSPLPLWAQVRDDLVLRVEAGEFSGPRAFPGEMALRDEYGVSRQTVRQALSGLRTDGVLVGTRGRPPSVADPALIQQPLGALYSLHASVEAAGLAQRSEVLALEIVTDPEVALLLALPPRAALLHLERRRMAGDEPLAHDHAWLPAALTRPLLEADFTHTALYTELAARCGIHLTGGREQVRAVIPTATERRLLGIGTRTAALSIERIGCLNGIPTELRRTLVRGDRFAVSAEFSRTTGYRMAPTGALPAPPTTTQPTDIGRENPASPTNRGSR